MASCTVKTIEHSSVRGNVLLVPFHIVCVCVCMCVRITEVYSFSLTQKYGMKYSLF